MQGVDAACSKTSSVCAMREKSTHISEGKSLGVFIVVLSSYFRTSG